MRGGPGPSSALLPRCGRSAPRPGGFCKDIVPAPTMRGAAPLCTPPDAGAPPCTRVTFSPMRKSPKNLQGLRPLESPSAESPPLLRSLRCAPARAGLPSATNLDRFATLSLWVNRPWFLPKLYWSSHFLLSIRGAAGLPLRMPRAFLPATNTARAGGRGIKGGKAPFAGGPGTRRSLAYLCLLSLREKVGRGAGRSARSRGLWGRSPHFGKRRGAAPLARKLWVPTHPLGRDKNGGRSSLANGLEGAPCKEAGNLL